MVEHIYLHKMAETRPVYRESESLLNNPAPDRWVSGTAMTVVYELPRVQRRQPSSADRVHTHIPLCLYLPVFSPGMQNQ